MLSAGEVSIVESSYGTMSAIIRFRRIVRGISPPLYFSIALPLPATLAVRCKRVRDSSPIQPILFLDLVRRNSEMRRRNPEKLYVNTVMRRNNIEVLRASSRIA